MSQASSSSNFDSVLGRLVIEQGLATSEEVDACRTKHLDMLGESDASHKSLAGILIDDGVVTQRQIDRLRHQADEQRATRKIPGFKIIKPLGAGAMAKVYLAKQLSLDRLVAIKILPKKFTSNERFVERFYAEGKAAGRLNHPNIVGALDVGRAGDTHYFVMEYVEGKTVFDLIIQDQRCKESEALNIIIQTAKALEHAHANGLIHRDVKPKNIMITPDGTVKLADMGLARPVNDREAAEEEKGKAYGTPYFISPEQIRGVMDVDFRADIYSLGATFYHMVTGRVPFEGDNPSAVMHKHLREPLVPPDQINHSLSAGTCEVIEVCMAKDRAKRYNSSADLLEDLEAVQSGEAPPQARKKFDLTSLSALEPTGTVGETQTTQPLATPISQQPLLWIAVTGWIVAVILLVVISLTS